MAGNIKRANTQNTQLTNKTSKNRVVNLSNWEDINAYDFAEYTKYSSKYIYFGKNNDYPSYLRNLYLSSPTHQAVVDGVVNLATGEGVEVVNPDKNPLSNKWLNDNFSKEVVKKLISDLKIYGYAAVQVFDGNLVKYSEAIKYRFAEKCEDGTISEVWYSNDWDFYQERDNRPEKLPIYVEGTDEPISVMIIQLDKKGYDYYSPVDYNGGINWISLEKEISVYHLSNIKNGLVPSFLLTFIGDEFSDEQMNQTERDVNKKFGGSTNAGRAIISFTNNKDNATQVTTMDQPNIDATYQFLSTECSNKILISHGVTSPLLFGIRDTGGGLGSNTDELKTAFYLFYESKLKHYQNYILEMITKIMNGNLLYADIKFKTYNPFNMSDNTQQLSKVELINEVDSQLKLMKIDENSVKTDDILISEKIFDGKLNENALYKFVKASKNNNIINKKYELLDKKDFLFKPNDDIKNTSDYYFIEQIYLKTNK